MTLIKLCYILIYTTHLIACLWFKVGIMQKGIHWQELYLDSDNFYDKYITSFYWAITTMLTVGYGDILPTTSLEKLFAIFTMLTGCCLFAYIINSLGTIIDEIKNSDENLRYSLIIQLSSLEKK